LLTERERPGAVCGDALCGGGLPKRRAISVGVTGRRRSPISGGVLAAGPRWNASTMVRMRCSMTSGASLWLRGGCGTRRRQQSVEPEGAVSSQVAVARETINPEETVTESVPAPRGA
jgi:hypothetical protein